MAVHFPRLPLEALGISPGSREALALVAGEGRKAHIHERTEGAARLGIRIGQSPAAALALAPTLEFRPREPAREQGALLKLAAGGRDFTPTVSLEAPAALLLEIEGSAHLFGGDVGIRARASQRFATEGFSAVLAVAPTPLSALWLAQVRQETTVTGLDELRSVLGKLPMQPLAPTPEMQDAFERLGIRHLAELLRLPRDGVAKRFGTAFLDTLDRALGLSPDPRSNWQAPRRCRASRQLPGEFTSLDHLQPFIADLLTELCRDLRAHDAGTDKLGLMFRHWKRPPTTVSVGSALPCRDPDRWEELLQAQLADLRLPSPVHELQLLSGRLQPFLAQSQDLLRDRRSDGGSFTTLVDVLRARLGRQRIFGLAATSDSRPEWASEAVEPGFPMPVPHLSPLRPIHLLAAPLPLTYRASRLHHQGDPLKLIHGPERIQGGWWEGETWSRDYYHACSSRGGRLWVFHEAGRWFLQGFFS
jgi:protein ImuB